MRPETLPIWPEIGATALEPGVDLRTGRPASRDEPTEEGPPSEVASDESLRPGRRWPSWRCRRGRHHRILPCPPRDRFSAATSFYRKAPTSPCRYGCCMHGP